MRSMRVHTNGATMVGWALVAIGGAVMFLDEKMGLRPETGFKIGGAILVLAVVVYLAGRIAMLVRDPKR